MTKKDGNNKKEQVILSEAKNPRFLAASRLEMTKRECHSERSEESHLIFLQNLLKTPTFAKFSYKT